jgi:hypothetical protein
LLSEVSTFFQEAQTMNSIKIRLQRGVIAYLFAAACLSSIAHAQQANAEQEFFDAIRQGKTEKVNELLQQRDAMAAWLRERGGKQ